MNTHRINNKLCGALPSFSFHVSLFLMFLFYSLPLFFDALFIKEAAELLNNKNVLTTATVFLSMK